MRSKEQNRSDLAAYGIPGLRVISAALLAPFLIVSWWVGQGCVDDPCEISRSSEWWGLATLFVAGAIGLRVAARRHWLPRCGVWLLMGVPPYFANRNAEPTVEGPVTSEAPGVASIGNVLLLGYMVVLIVTLGIELWEVRRARAELD